MTMNTILRTEKLTKKFNTSRATNDVDQEPLNLWSSEIVRRRIKE